MAIDPITLEVIANRLEEIQRIMRQRLFRTGYSTILRESFDGGTGMTDGTGRVVGASGMTIHTRPYGRFVSGILAAYRTDEIREGDVFLSNDPYRGGVTHSPDMAVGTPVFMDGKLTAFCTSIAHKPDIGGLAPGTVSPASRSIFHEGLLVPPCKLVDRGEVVDAVRRILENNSRTPKLLIGDLFGQVGCTRIGAQLLQELGNREGRETIIAVIDQLIDSSEHRLRTALARLPDGEATAENFLDGDGVAERPIRIAVRVIKQGESITLDFTGTEAQTQGPANAVVQVVEAAAIAGVLGVVDYTITNNEGVRRPIDFVLPAGTVVNPVSPAPVNSYIPTIHLVYNAVMEAIGKLAPERAVADTGVGLGAMTFGYAQGREGRGYVHYEIPVTGLGGTAESDGCPSVTPVINLESVQPIEVVESEFPVRITDFSMWPDSAGAGLHRGAIGLRREFEFLEDTQFVSRLSQRRHGARGIAGGKPPPVARTVLIESDGAQRDLPGLVQLQLRKGDRIRIEQPGGGGWGDPRKRPAEDVRRDVEDGVVSVESARRDYGRVV
jgi:N-methylhydantoinase B